MKIPEGFRAAGVACGIKAEGPDLALIASDRPATAAGLFTSNRVKAAPVIYSRRALRKGRARAIVANSGCANACTGPRGLEDARRMARAVARALEVPEGEVLVASTGVIGEPLPIERIEGAVPDLAEKLSPQGFEEAARAIMTTDTCPKLRWATVPTSAGEVTILGIAKGAGMIRPDLATMLAFIVTDAGLSPQELKGMLRDAVSESFNKITVDGEQSTNDTVFILANGSKGELLGEDLESFGKALMELCQGLALDIVRDGEGATMVAEIVISGARTSAEAKRAAYRIAHSPLVKTALFGRDPNWGRIMAALGDAGLKFDPARVLVRIGGVDVVRGGMMAAGYDERAAKRAFEGWEVKIEVDLGLGEGTFSVLTCDLSYDYVKINASYRT